MTHRGLILYLCGMAMLVATVSATAGDIHLTLDNGTGVMLHDNHTWSCDDAGVRQQLVDMVIALEDGQEVHLGGDGIWSFVVDEQATEDVGMSMLYQVGVGRATKVVDAIEHARNRALDGLTKRMRPLVDTDVSDTDLRACIEDMDKQVDHSEKKRGDTYEVRIKMTLDKTAIQAVRECVALSARIKERTSDGQQGEE
ncbi:MAG: hypothetical protein GF331_22140 [Chitinivibrionales bacterium]|nr:hypothetical protein [Chitinivibrionales bacterium]